MTDRPSEPDAGGGDAGSTPRWVKLFGVVALLLVLLIVVLLLAGGGHRPGRHSLSGADAGYPSIVSFSDRDGQPW